MKIVIKLFGIIALGLLIQSGCSKTNRQSPKKVTLTLGAYTVPKDAYQKEIIPAFRKYWKQKTGQIVRLEESYEASGAQSRSIAAGFEADIAALSLEKDINRLKDAGLITHDWKNSMAGGFVTNSVVVIAYRPGNPKRIQDWDDLKREKTDPGDVELFMPYHANLVTQADDAETLLYARRKVNATNPHFEVRVEGRQTEMRNWFLKGAEVMAAEAPLRSD